MSVSHRSFERLREQDERDAQRLAYAIRGPLHYTTGTPECRGSTLCDMCANAARLAVQSYRPVIAKRVVETIQNLYGIRCEMSHPGDND